MLSRGKDRVIPCLALVVGLGKLQLGDPSVIQVAASLGTCRKSNAQVFPQTFRIRSAGGGMSSVGVRKLLGF